MRVLVCGGRDYYNKKLIKKTLDELHAKTPITCLIQGGATGVDWLANHWAKVYGGMPIEEYKADWGLGRSAGPQRNAVMLKVGRPDLVVAFHGKKGTADMVRKAKSAKVTVVEVADDGWLEKTN